MKVHITAVADTLNEIREFDDYQSIMEYMEGEYGSWNLFWGPFDKKFMSGIFSINESADIRIEKYDDYRE